MAHSMQLKRWLKESLKLQMDVLITDLLQININNIIGGAGGGLNSVPLLLRPNSSVRFTGRNDVLALLKNHFRPRDNRQPTARRTFLLHGMGGIGKTQICLKFIEDTFDRYALRSMNLNSHTS